MLASVSDSLSETPWNAYLKLSQEHRARYFAATERDKAPDFTAWATRVMDDAARGTVAGIPAPPREPAFDAALARVRYAFRSATDEAAIRSAVLLVGDIIATNPALLAGFMAPPAPPPNPAPPAAPRGRK